MMTWSPAKEGEGSGAAMTTIRKRVWGGRVGSTEETRFRPLKLAEARRRWRLGGGGRRGRKGLFGCVVNIVLGYMFIELIWKQVFCSDWGTSFSQSFGYSPLGTQVFSDDPDRGKWKDKEREILNDIEPVVLLAKEILHSYRCMDGEQLTEEDEKVVVERLLAHHPHSEDKIGCAIDSIMVDRHPQFKHSRCLFVIRTDGVWIDFYQKCLQAYIRDKYPSHADRFIREHFKRSSG